jgi:hypothetical protein
MAWMRRTGITKSTSVCMLPLSGAAQSAVVIRSGLRSLMFGPQFPRT